MTLAMHTPSATQALVLHDSHRTLLIHNLSALVSAKTSPREIYNFHCFSQTMVMFMVMLLVMFVVMLLVMLVVMFMVMFMVMLVVMLLWNTFFSFLACPANCHTCTYDADTSSTKCADNSCDALYDVDAGFACSGRTHAIAIYIA